MISRLFATAEKRLPAGLKNIFPEAWRVQIGRFFKETLRGKEGSVDPLALAKMLEQAGYDPERFLQLPIPVPDRFTLASLIAELGRFKIREFGDVGTMGHTEEEFDAICHAYLEFHIIRYLYTLALLPKQTEGRLLEVGPSPYQFSLLVNKFTRYTSSYVDYFDVIAAESGSATMISDAGERHEFPFHNLNIETSKLPFADSYFDCIALCEVIEHLVEDPLRVLLELKRTLKEGGLFILTTPNVAGLTRMNNLLNGENIYHPYSGFGIYDRHNREYTSRELIRLLEHVGFEIQQVKTSNIRPTNGADFAHWSSMIGTLRQRQHDLGEFTLISAVNAKEANHKKPAWLYDNFPAAELHAD